MESRNAYMTYCHIVLCWYYTVRSNSILIFDSVGNSNYGFYEDMMPEHTIMLWKQSVILSVKKLMIDYRG